jgi:hypothetical protein
MRVLTDADGYVTLRLSEFPNTAFDIETDVYDDDEDGISGTVTLVAVDPANDPLLEPPSPVLAEALAKIEALAVQMHGEEKARAIAARWEQSKQRDIAIAEAAAQARAAAVAQKFTRGADGTGSDVPKAG